MLRKQKTAQPVHYTFTGMFCSQFYTFPFYVKFCIVKLDVSALWNTHTSDTR